MIADVAIAPNRPDNDVMFEHDASLEMSKKYTVEIHCYQRWYDICVDSSANYTSNYITFLKNQAGVNEVPVAPEKNCESFNPYARFHLLSFHSNLGFIRRSINFNVIFCCFEFPEVN